MTNHVDRLRDEIAILEYRAGDTAALGPLISRWQMRIYAYILATVGDREQAWDVSQEVWIAVVSALRRKTDVRCFAAWLYRIAHNKSISYLRYKGCLMAHEDDLSANGDPPDPAALRDDVAFGVEDAAAIRECLMELRLGQREAMTLFYLDELSLDEIARVLDVPLGTVQSRLHYGRKSLRELLVRKGYGNGK